MRLALLLATFPGLNPHWLGLVHLFGRKYIFIHHRCSHFINKSHLEQCSKTISVSVTNNFFSLIL
jgi:hypothetical protein